MAKYYTAYLPIIENGEKKYKKFYGKTKKEAEAKRDKAKWEYENGLLTLTRKTTFGRYAENYFETYVRPAYGSHANYRSYHNMFMKTFAEISGMEIGEVKKTHLQRCINGLQGYSKSYIKLMMTGIRSMFRSAVADEVIIKNPSLLLVAPNYDEKERRALTDEERNLLMKAVPKVEDGVFFAIMLSCGLRPQEVRALTWNDINLNKGTLSVTGAIKTETMTKGSTKSSAGMRTVVMPDKLIAMLSARPKTAGFVFGGVKPLQDKEVRAIWHKIHKEMDILGGAVVKDGKVITHSVKVGQDLTPYYLRHTYATALAENGVDMKTAQYLLGHSNISMTAKVYTHVTPKMIETAAEKIKNII